jgi:hypothetical protein
LSSRETFLFANFLRGALWWRLALIFLLGLASYFSSSLSAESTASLAILVASARLWGLVILLFLEFALEPSVLEGTDLQTNSSSDV